MNIPTAMHGQTAFGTARPGFSYLRGISERDGSVVVNFFTHQPALNYGFGEYVRKGCNRTFCITFFGAGLPFVRQSDHFG